MFKDVTMFLQQNPEIICEWFKRDDSYVTYLSRGVGGGGKLNEVA